MSAYHTSITQEKFARIGSPTVGKTAKEVMMDLQSTDQNTVLPVNITIYDSDEKVVAGSQEGGKNGLLVFETVPRWKGAPASDTTPAVNIILQTGPGEWVAYKHVKYYNPLFRQLNRSGKANYVLPFGTPHGGGMGGRGGGADGFVSFQATGLPGTGSRLVTSFVSNPGSYSFVDGLTRTGFDALLVPFQSPEMYYDDLKAACDAAYEELHTSLDRRGVLAFAKAQGVDVTSKTTKSKAYADTIRALAQRGLITPADNAAYLRVD